MRIFNAWRRQRMVGGISAVLVLLACLVMFLSAVGTIDVGFTVKPSYGLLLIALGIGAPWAVRGWVDAPRRPRHAAALLVAAYVLAIAFGHPQGLPSEPGRSTHRDFAYLFDLLLGLGVMGLICGLGADPRLPLTLGRVSKVLALGAVLGASLGLYQWVARHYGWPASDLNNAVNSDGFSHGHRYQGAGLFGWERARGPFKEPLAMATFLAASLPFVGYAVSASRSLQRLAWLAGLMLTSAALILTDSALGWAAAFVTIVVTAALASTVLGRRKLAAASGVLLCCCITLIPVLATDPAIFGALTNRGQAQLTTTLGNRTGAWAQAIRVWEQKPIIGNGPGQSAVRLAYRPAGAAIRPGLIAPVVLGSAQGLWAAVLIDGGIVELIIWLAFLLALMLCTASAAARDPDPLRFAVFGAMLAYLILAQISGDRLDIEVWVTLGLGLMASRKVVERSGNVTGE